MKEVEGQMALDDPRLGHPINLVHIPQDVAYDPADDLFDHRSDNVPQAEVVQKLEELGDHRNLKLTIASSRFTLISIFLKHDELCVYRTIASRSY